MEKEIWMNVSGTEKRIAIKEKNKVVEFFIDRPTLKKTEGNIYIGRVIKVLPGMQAAFVDIGGKDPGFLYRDHIASYQVSTLKKSEKEKTSISKWIHEGEAVVVQVVKEGEGTKGPKLTGLIEFPGEYIVYQPFGRFKSVSKKMNKDEREKWRLLANSWCTKEEGIIIRTSSEAKQVNVVEQELQQLQQEYIEIQKKAEYPSKVPLLLKEDQNIVKKIVRDVQKEEISRIVVDDSDTFQWLKRQEYSVQFYHGKENIFSKHGIEEELNKALKRIVWLPSGGYIIIEHTEAMTVIDVNSGKYTGKTERGATFLKVNEEAAREIAKQLRLRNIGGIIIIDFIEMKHDSEREKVLAAFKEEIRADRATVIPVGFTQLDLLQVTRKKIREPLTQLLMEQCNGCNGAGMVNSVETVVYKLEREIAEQKGKDIEAFVIEASPDVIKMFPKEALPYQIYFRAVERNPFYDIRFVGSDKEAKNRIQSLKHID